MGDSVSRASQGGQSVSRAAAARWVGLALVGLVALLGAAPGLAWADGTEIAGLRSSATAERSRLVFQLDGPVEHQVFTLTDPHRVVVDIADVAEVAELAASVPTSQLIEQVRHAPRDGDDWRVVLDLEQAARPKSFLLKPQGQYGHRLVLDLHPADQAEPTERAQQGERRKRANAGQARDLVIAIDPGHGGKDPGATGPNGTREKDVVLSVAQRLHDLLANTPGYEPVMTRHGDEYLSLRDRIQIAREARADMFISLHADAFPDQRATGSSVYALSVNGASSESARRLAERENSADLIGGVSLEDKDETLASVLLDLSQTAPIESSLDAGERVLNELGSVNDLHKRSVQQAGFVVLKSPDVPSILVETAFISNPTEERQLRQRQHQQDLAEAIHEGVRNYFRNQAPPGTRIYARNRPSNG
ncbi:MAG: N-acetylmuramoyl-L-alanine amidase [Proteobacteria bacterium SW_6_67_9]|nr:MAG: N-acetylmuramoyl-L-alanine amidase [Proteobacteria bacterium SW_6_67_9]